jgi:hypothetical protein
MDSGRRGRFIVNYQLSILMAELDVYRDWLGIKETARPLDFYQLLRLDRFEDNVDRIRRHYRKLNAHARKYSSGKFAELSQQVLNELARAMLCLTDAARKADYDTSLGRQSRGDRRQRTLEDLLVERQAVTRVNLEKALKFASATGMSVRDAVLQQKLAAPDVVMQIYAESLGLPYLDLADVTIEPELLRSISAVTARTYSFVPVMVDDGQLLLASPNPLALDVEEDIRTRVGMPIRMVLCTPTEVHRLVNEHYSRETASEELRARTAEPKAKTNTEPSGFSKMWDKLKKLANSDLGGNKK